MQTIRLAALTSLVVALTAATSQAQVQVTGVHLCCGMCNQAVAKAMADVDGVSSVSCDRGSRTVSFNAAGDEAIKEGLAALAKAGFHGDAELGNRKLEYPAEKVEKNAKSDEITFYGVHLCCGGCAKAVAEALKEIGEASADREARVVVVKGDAISVAKAMEALNKAGFHGSLKKPEAEEGK